MQLEVRIDCDGEQRQDEDEVGVHHDKAVEGAAAGLVRHKRFCPFYMEMWNDRWKIGSYVHMKKSEKVFSGEPKVAIDLDGCCPIYIAAGNCSLLDCNLRTCRQNSAEKET